MKKLISILFFTGIFVSCDKVPPRIPPEKPACVLDSSEMLVNKNESSNKRKVLLEDYTGHTCGNCPPAIAKVEELSEKYPRVIALANHVTKTYAAPLVASGKYIEDFRDPASTEWDATFGMSGSSGLPTGSVNRILINDSRRLEYANWEQYVKDELAKPQSVKLDVTTYYDPSQKLLNVKVFTTFLTAISSNVNLLMILSLDSLVTDQKDYQPPAGVQVVDGDRRPDFHFNHIMVKSINGTWGQSLKAAPISKSDTITIRKDCNSVTKCFYQGNKGDICADDQHMYLVVFAYNETTREVLQVEKVKLIPEE